jgi:endonuclease YncB( thermonuclease family)
MNCLEHFEYGLNVGHFGPGMHGERPGTPKEIVHDGDTIKVKALGNFSVRFLGIDTPEISFTLPGDKKHFPEIADLKWEKFLSDPFTSQYPPLALDEGLKADLLKRLGPGAAKNHFDHAKEAEKALEMEITNDKNLMGWTDATFKFFVAFAHEIMDRYGRLLAYINRENPKEPRPLDYNMRQLDKGMACPYAIWPNVGEAAGHTDSLTMLVLEPFTAAKWAEKDKYLKKGREFVAAARKKQIGIFDKKNPLRIEPFELRFLSDRRAPQRWVIDLSKNDDVLVAPENYYRIKMEDRLFVPEEFVPLFESKGWKKQAIAAKKAA